MQQEYERRTQFFAVVEIGAPLPPRPVNIGNFHTDKRKTRLVERLFYLIVEGMH
jgi:hypothetical protein